MAVPQNPARQVPPTQLARPVMQKTWQQAKKTILQPVVSPKKKEGAALLIVAAIVVSLAGISTGWLMSGGIARLRGKTTGPAEAKPGQKEAGISDESTFRDSAEGVLKEGGIKGEGRYHLEPGDDPTKYVYLISTVIDLETFLDKKVQVWGETIAAKHAPWLMDVGKIKVIE